MDEEKSHQATLSRVAEVVKRCPHFGEWEEFCNLNCDLYDFCDKIFEIQNASKASKDE